MSSKPTAATPAVSWSSKQTLASRVDSDFDAFSAALSGEASGWFAPGSVSIARAPGRLDVMGGIADYSGSLVAEMPIADSAVCAAQPDPSGAVHVRTLSGGPGIESDVVLDPELFINPVSLLRHLRESPESRQWAGYVAGCVSILRAEGLIRRGMGARLLLRSDVPLGAGVSSSAAIEVAAMRALVDAFGIELDGLALARYCQRVENEIVDAPCGIMDQVTSALGQEGELLLLRCQPHTVEGTLRLPDGWSVFGIDSGVKHSVAGAGYTGVRVAASMGFKILADRAKQGFGGWLCNVGSERYRAITEAEVLPETLDGRSFLKAHGGILDTVVTVDPGISYPVRAATEHPIFEMERVTRFVECLRDGSDAAMAEAGSQMRGSHRSYSACGLGSDATDLLVELACDGAWKREVAGAKITGGGSGGTVCVLVRADSEAAASTGLAAAYQSKTGISPRVIRGTSPGAVQTPVRRRDV